MINMKLNDTLYMQKIYSILLRTFSMHKIMYKNKNK